MSEPARRVVVLGSAKGSPGCSFLAAGLARRLAEAGLDTLLVDADAEDRGLAAALGVEAGAGERLLARAGGLGGLDADLLHRAAAPAGPGLWLVEAPAGGELDGRDLAGAGREAFAAVVADLGHQHGPLQRQLAAAADWALWVVAPDRLGLERADRALRERPLPAASSGIVLNRVSAASLEGAGRVLSDRHRMPVVATLVEAPAAARGRAPHRARRLRGGFGRLALTVHPAAPAVRGIWG